MMIKAAVAQVGSAMFDTPATLSRIEAYCRKASAAGAQLIVFPEALLGGYPKGLTFGATVGTRTDEGREMFRRYFDAAIACPGPETEALANWARELALHIVIGVIERAGATLYCTSLIFAPEEGPPDLGHGRRFHYAGFRHRSRPHRHGDLLGELHAALPPASLRTGRADLVRAHSGCARNLAGEHEAHRL
jgi:hypothetical protein